jgi:transcriptional regulator with XRE-family HTH domain
VDSSRSKHRGDETKASREPKPPSELGVFLKSLRQRLDPNVRDLGSYARLPGRRGRRVTQEELAEAIGVNREWYAMLECGAATRVSTSLLGRLADALMVTPEERARLFQAGVPEFARAQLREDSIEILEAFSGLRVLSKRLWTATSIEDVLTTSREHMAGWFDSALFVRSSLRHGAGVWESRAADRKRTRNTALKDIREVSELLESSASSDALWFYPRLSNAGEVGTPDLYPLPLQRERLELYARRRLPAFTFAKARVRSRTGLIGGFCIAHRSGHSYSAFDHAVFGAFADLTSWALS